ncbi:MAG: hypothetical protein LBK25_00170 [Treponema sp.]|nr:hypothetical protein [Treponema sp.]
MVSSYYKQLLANCLPNSLTWITLSVV